MNFEWGLFYLRVKEFKLSYFVKGDSFELKLVRREVT